MNVSRDEQRVLHALAQGARIHHARDERGKIVEAMCKTRTGWVLDSCTLGVFRALKEKRLIASMNGHPYRITRKGLSAVRAQLDNRG